VIEKAPIAAHATVVYIALEIETFVDQIVAVVVATIADLFTRWGAGILAAIFGPAVDVHPARFTRCNCTLTGHALTECVIGRTGTIASATMELIGVEVEVFIDQSVTVVVQPIAILYGVFGTLPHLSVRGNDTTLTTNQRSIRRESAPVGKQLWNHIGHERNVHRADVGWRHVCIATVKNAVRIRSASLDSERKRRDE
jgi:hypothetical protein